MLANSLNCVGRMVPRPSLLNNFAFLTQNNSFSSSLAFLSEDKEESEMYDLICIGGGSGGFATAVEAGRVAQKNRKPLKIAIVDEKERLGGTCLNVGEVPKKLMHFSSIMGTGLKHSDKFGWSVASNSFKWNKLVQAVENHVHYEHSQNAQLLEKYGIEHIKGVARFTDPHTLETTSKTGDKKVLKSKRFVVAVGGTPRIPPTPGAFEYGSSSDDIFYLKREPGKSLIVGAGYIALETAGFLRGMGYDVNVLVRTDILGGMDLDCSNRIVKFLKAKGIGFIESATIHSLTKDTKTGRLKVIVKNTFDKYDTGPRIVDLYDTVFFGIGRYSVANRLGLEQIGVKLSGAGRVVVDDWQQSTLPHIYSVGDCMEGGIALTPVAVKTGQLLAKRLFDHPKTNDHKYQLKDPKLRMAYDQIPTTVFTPVEYAYVGLSEEEARAKHKGNVEVYYKNFKPLCWSLGDVGGLKGGKEVEKYLLEEDEKQLKALIKVIVDKKDNEKVLGVHYCGPDAGEIIQGIAVAFRTGNLRKEHLDQTIGIHPTIAEELCYLTQKKSDPDFLTL